MDIDFKRNLIKLLCGMIWATIPYLAFLIIVLPRPQVPEIQYEEVLILLAATLVLNFLVSLMPLRRPFVIRYHQILYFLTATIFCTSATLAIIYTGGVRSFFFPFLLMVVCFGTTFYATMTTTLVLMTLLSVLYTLAMVYFTDFVRTDIQWLCFQILSIFLMTFFINRLGLDSREQVRIKNEALRELKLLSEMDEATSNFVSAVSFEMRTPLTSIQGFSEMLLHQDLPEEKEREFIDIINKEAEHLTELVEELLDISRLESGKAKLKRQEVDISRMLRASVNVLGTICAPEDLMVDVPEELPSLYLDLNRVSKVLTTVFNHVERDCEDGAEVRVSAKVAEESLVLTFNYRPVRDKGSESETEFLEEIGVESREEDLDIAIARRIVLAHGGSMNIVHTPGNWSTLVFRLPVMELEEYLAEERTFTA